MSEKPRRMPGRLLLLAVLILLLAGAHLLSGCVGNKAEATALKIERSRKSTTAENIEAGGRVLGGIGNWLREGKQ